MKVGIVGAGQLARMLLESASVLGIEVVVLAETMLDGAALTAHEVRLGSPKDPSALRALAGEVDVVTFDHELVDLDTLLELESDGMAVHPSPSTLLYAVDKAAMRRLCEGHGFPGPRFVLLGANDAADIEGLGAHLGWPLILKTARGGYDGRGVFRASDATSAATVIDQIQADGIDVVVEEIADIIRELAIMVARRPGGETVVWPAVETAQIDGVCREVLLPGAVHHDVAAAAEAFALEIADAVALVGVMAVELFETPDGLRLNELAMRPHNSGHWTQDGAITSQFENHLRAVLDLPLGSTAMTASAVASVNVFGGPDGSPPLLSGLPGALRVPGAHVHLYGKETRPMRKLGHVTVTGDDAEVARHRAWEAAIALGTPVPAEIEERI